MVHLRDRSVGDETLDSGVVATMPLLTRTGQSLAPCLWVGDTVAALSIGAST